MRPAWLIEAGVYGEEAVPLLNEIRRQGMAAEVIPYQALKRGAAAPVVAGGNRSPPTDASSATAPTRSPNKSFSTTDGLPARGVRRPIWTARLTTNTSAGSF